MYRIIHIKRRYTSLHRKYIARWHDCPLFFLYGPLFLMKIPTVMHNYKSGADPGGRGGAPGARPPKIGKNINFWVKSWFFTRNIPKIYAPPSARRDFFVNCAPPPHLKSWIRLCKCYMLCQSRICIVYYLNPSANTYLFVFTQAIQCSWNYPHIRI